MSEIRFASDGLRRSIETLKWQRTDRGAQGAGMRLAAGLLALCLCGVDAARACDVRVESAWIREPPPRAATLAGFATLVNGADRAHRIVAAESDAAGMIMFHETMLHGDMAMMRELREVPVPARGKTELAPGGRHLMLMAVKSALRAGDHVTITLLDETGCRIAADFVVRRQ
jgi:copper(I)-binding protein